VVVVVVVHGFPPRIGGSGGPAPAAGARVRRAYGPGAGVSKPSYGVPT
jgi:hypothetical protein